MMRAYNNEYIAHVYIMILSAVQQCYIIFVTHIYTCLEIYILIDKSNIPFIGTADEKEKSVYSFQTANIYIAETATVDQGYCG